MGIVSIATSCNERKTSPVEISRNGTSKLHNLYLETTSNSNFSNTLLKLIQNWYHEKISAVVIKCKNLCTMNINDDHERHEQKE